MAGGYPRRLARGQRQATLRKTRPPQNATWSQTLPKKSVTWSKTGQTEARRFLSLVGNLAGGQVLRILVNEFVDPLEEAELGCVRPQQIRAELGWLSWLGLRLVKEARQSASLFARVPIA